MLKTGGMDPCLKKVLKGKRGGVDDTSPLNSIKGEKGKGADPGPYKRQNGRV